MITLEICCGDLASVIAAKAGGARRIELCSGLSEGGLTPSLGLIRKAVESGLDEINVLIRPRPGDFLYSECELSMMEEDIRTAIRAGATGVVIGVLTPEGDVDCAAMQRLIDVARATAAECGRLHCNITFHRAFDVARDLDKSLEEIITLGCDCLLTSGAAQSAVKGLHQLKKTVNRAAGRITVMAGAGINPSNAREIVEATGVQAIHATARKPMASRMKFRQPLVSMGVPGSDEYAPLSTSPDIVAKLISL
jgi:copper homeostasis protein